MLAIALGKKNLKALRSRVLQRAGGKLCYLCPGYIIKNQEWSTKK
jgi:adenosylmethionine-8-amino-7-oxononanoate aminotransferase